MRWEQNSRLSFEDWWRGFCAAPPPPSLPQAHTTLHHSSDPYLILLLVHPSKDKSRPLHSFSAGPTSHTALSCCLIVEPIEKRKKRCSSGPAVNRQDNACSQRSSSLDQVNLLINTFLQYNFLIQLINLLQLYTIWPKFCRNLTITHTHMGFPQTVATTLFRKEMYRTSLYAKVLQFPFTGTKSPKPNPSP